MSRRNLASASHERAPRARHPDRYQRGARLGLHRPGRPAVRAQLAEVIVGDQRSTPVVTMVLQSLPPTSSFLHVQRFNRHDWLADQPAAEAA
jgi:hypothetical protein